MPSNKETKSNNICVCNTVQYVLVQTDICVSNEKKLNNCLSMGVQHMIYTSLLHKYNGTHQNYLHLFRVKNISVTSHAEDLLTNTK